MRYHGGKSKIARIVAATLSNLREPSQLYVEPFVGAGSVLQRMRNPRVASDSNEDLILLYLALQQGWQPPDFISKEEYDLLKGSAPSPLRAVAGFGCSFAGQWFAGYAQPSWGHTNYALEAKNSLLRQAPLLKGAQFFLADYREIEYEGALIYCDPPYAGTMGFRASEIFNQFDFWDTMGEWSKRNTVVVSGYEAPSNFECVLDLGGKSASHRGSKNKQVAERLYILK